jgi:CBS domain-containing protein
MGKATVREAMTASPRSIESGESVVQAARMMANENVGSLPVVDGDRLVGMLTDRDIVTRVVAEERDPSSTSVKEVASGKLVTAEANANLDDAMLLMARHQVRRLPVVEDGRLVGILAQADLAETLGDKETGRLVEAISEPPPGEVR